MPYVKEQIDIINTALETGTLKDKRFSGSRYMANVRDITTSLDGGNIVEPAAVNEYAQATKATPNDDYPLCIYHRVNNTIYNDNIEQYGDNNPLLDQLLDCSMIVYGKVTRLNLTPEMLEAVIVSGFPTAIKSTIFPYGLLMMTVSVKSSTTDQQAIWNQEYKNVPLSLSQEDIYIKVNYLITSRYKKDCVAICC